MVVSEHLTEVYTVTCHAPFKKDVPIYRDYWGVELSTSVRFVKLLQDLGHKVTIHTASKELANKLRELGHGPVRLKEK